MRSTSFYTTSYNHQWKFMICSAPNTLCFWSKNENSMYSTTLYIWVEKLHSEIYGMKKIQILKDIE